MATLKAFRDSKTSALLEVQTGNGWALHVDGAPSHQVRFLKDDPTGWASMRLEGQVDVAVRVEITGTTFTTLEGGQAKVRGRVTFLGDGELDTVHGCWIYFPQNALSWPRGIA